MKLNKPLNLLIPDGESDLALDLIRCLSEDKKIKIYVLSSFKWVESRYSKYISSFSVLPSIEPQYLGLISIILNSFSFLSYLKSM